MPRYCFGWLEGDQTAILDEKQIDLPDFDAVVHEARRALTERVDETPSGNVRTVGITVRDNEGNYLLRRFARPKTEP